MWQYILTKFVAIIPSMRFTRLIPPLFCLLLTPAIIESQVMPPGITCIETLADGQISIQFGQASVPTGSVWLNNLIFTSLSPGVPFTQITSISDLSVNSFVVNGTGGNSNDQYFYLQSTYNENGAELVSSTSDTLRNIFLDASPAGNNCLNCDSSVYLSWNSPYMPDFEADSSIVYEIWTDYPGGSWQLLTTVPYGQNELVYIVENCLPQFMNFQIIYDIGPCSFISNVSGDFFSDNSHPNTAFIGSVSVSPEGDGVISWPASSSPDVEGYWVYRCVGSATNLMDYVLAADTISYIDFLANSATGPLSYAIAAMDFCGNTDTTICVSSVFAQITPFESCDTVVAIEWLPYSGWDSLPLYYIVQRAVSDTQSFITAEFITIDTLEGSLQNYYDYNFPYGNHVGYRIVAVSPDNHFLSVSNVVAVFIPANVRPAFMEITYMESFSDDSLLIVLKKQPTQDVYRYHFERWNTFNQEWDRQIMYESSLDDSLMFWENNVSLDALTYEYRVLAENVCGVFVDTSQVCKSILLEGELSEDLFSNFLRWSTPLGNDSSAFDFSIIRTYISKIAPGEIARQTNGLDPFYEDKIVDFIDGDGRFCYRVHSRPLINDSVLGFPIVISNEVCLAYEPLIWIPNAMVYDGYNNQFKPVISFAGLKDYEFKIFSRWGDLVFFSEQPSEAWNGRFGDRAAKEGPYFYTITLKDGKERSFQYEGMLLLLVLDDDR
jgi:gliding motility-associated-like protein